MQENTLFLLKNAEKFAYMKIKLYLCNVFEQYY